MEGVKDADSELEDVEEVDGELEGVMEEDGELEGVKDEDGEKEGVTEEERVLESVKGALVAVGDKLKAGRSETQGREKAWFGGDASPCEFPPSQTKKPESP